eukprot:640968-Hanusia_phi.AAC.1
MSDAAAAARPGVSKRSLELTSYWASHPGGCRTRDSGVGVTDPARDPEGTESLPGPIMAQSDQRATVHGPGPETTRY